MVIPPSIHNLCDLLDAAAAKHPNKTALRDREENGYSQWAYSEFSNYVYSFARHLKKINSEKNITVGILLPNTKWWGLAFFATIACDAVVVPLDVKLTVEETSSIIKTAKIQTLITADSYKQKNEELKLICSNLKNIISVDLFLLNLLEERLY